MFTDATLNLRFNNTSRQHREDLRTMSRAGAKVCGLQEAQTPEVIRSIKTWLKHHPNWDVVWGGECPVLYRKSWGSVIAYNAIVVSEGVAKINPTRVINHVMFATDYGLIHYFNHHAEQQFTEQHENTEDYDYRVKVARKCFTELSLHAENKVGIVRIGGDLNVSLNNRERSWYPFRMRDEFKFDTVNGLDHIGYKMHAGVTLHNRRSIQVNSDHRLRLVDVRVNGK